MKASRPSARLEGPREHLLRLTRRARLQSAIAEEVLISGVPLPQKLGFDNLADKIRLAADALGEVREILTHLTKTPFRPTQW
jgi:hypothetical protein